MATIFQKLSHFLVGPEVSIFHEFQKPPYGGGNQFLIALVKELRRRGVDVGSNKMGPKTKAVLFNSFQFDVNKLESGWHKYKPKMIQRLAGPIGTYRGTDDKPDRDIWAWNGEFADSTIFISDYSYKKYLELGLVYKDPHIILNACDPDIFNTKDRIAAPDGSRKIRLIATAWSSNVKKGGPFLSWLDEHLDHSKYELTFVGRTEAKFKGAKVLEPVPSEKLADILRQNDIYIAPSQNDPCSNALVEALTCGLPAVFLKSGGHPELVKQGGESFTTNDEALTAIDKVSANYKHYQELIKPNTMSYVASEYLKVFGLHEEI